MYSVFTRTRIRVDGDLGDWIFIGLSKTVDYETIYQVVNQDGGQYLAMSFYTSQREFRSKPVPVKVYIKDKLEENNDWTLNIWQISETDTRLAWGLLWRNDPTHMNYELNIIIDTDLDVLFRYKDDPRWTFDAGRDIYVKKDDLKQSLKLLGIK